MTRQCSPLLALCLLAACGPTATTDAGTTPSQDAAVAAPDAAQGTQDASTTWVDAGGTTPDAASQLADAAANGGTDAGTTVGDAGSVVGDAGTTQEDAGTVSAPDAGPTSMAVTTVDGEETLLSVQGMRFRVPAGAVAVGTALDVTAANEDPGVPDVTAVTPVFHFGPAGTQFSEEVLVSFEVPGLPEGVVALVYWTNAAGEFEPQPSWRNGTTVHSLATHLSRAFVGTTPVVAINLVCTAGNDICSYSEPVAVCLRQAAPSASATGINVNVTRAPSGEESDITIRTTPVRPAALGKQSKGPVLDVSGTLAPGASAEICFKAGLTRAQGQDACLGYFDETHKEWKCQDECLKKAPGDYVCGATGHFTNFAVLLGGTSSSDNCSSKSDWIMGATGGVAWHSELTVQVPERTVVPGTTLDLVVLPETPAVPEVTPATELYQVGPAATVFTGEAFVSFITSDVPAGTAPVVFASNATGAYEPLPTWFDGEIVHALVKGPGKLFVGFGVPSRARLLCCNDAACTTRGVCLERTPLAQGSVALGGSLQAPGVVVSNVGAVGAAAVELAIRNTPVRPGELGTRSVGPVVDVGGVLGAGAKLEVCLTATLTAAELPESCLGFFDETDSRWKCQDKCLKEKNGDLCGTTDHLTSFAILLGANGGTQEQCSVAPPVCMELGSLPCKDGSCRLSCEGTCGAGEHLCADGFNCVAAGGMCPATMCPATAPFLCPEGSCKESRMFCTGTCGRTQVLCPNGMCQDACVMCALSEVVCPGGMSCAATLEMCPPG